MLFGRKQPVGMNAPKISATVKYRKEVPQYQLPITGNEKNNKLNN